MLFSSPTFLVFFLPLTLLAYHLLPWRNALLLLASFIFYAWGEPYFVGLLAGVILVNYCLGLKVADADTPRRRGRWLTAGIVLNVGVLVTFKYLDFFIAAVNTLLVAIGLPLLPPAHIPLPLGVSFFTFQAISYLVDLQRGEVRVERNLLHLALFKSVFPQLIAGPIVRYGEMSADLHERKPRWSAVVEGLELFLVGLAKKVLIADTLAVPADAIMQLPAAGLSAPAAWIGVLCFSLQIYFDFSGYTDMARGLGQAFGFHFPENFNHPYAATSVQDFWRRWHMTLSRWFRDYVYIPLGGSRCAPWRCYLNLTLVFGLCGLWHGANWTYVFWGLWHGLFLVLERTRFGPWSARWPVPLRHVYVLLVVGLGWVLFRSPSLDHALGYLGRMVRGGDWAQCAIVTLNTLNYFQIAMAVVGILLSTPLVVRLLSGPPVPRQTVAGAFARSVCLLVLVVATLGAISANTLQSFIYFRF